MVEDFDNYHDTISYMELGIRPAFYLNDENAALLSDGSVEDPYEMNGKAYVEEQE